MSHSLQDPTSEGRFQALVDELRRRVSAAQQSPRRARIALEVLIEDRRVSPLSEIILRRQPLRDRGLTNEDIEEQT